MAAQPRAALTIVSTRPALAAPLDGCSGLLGAGPPRPNLPHHNLHRSSQPPAQQDEQQYSDILPGWHSTCSDFGSALAACHRVSDEDDLECPTEILPSD